MEGSVPEVGGARRIFDESGHEAARTRPQTTTRGNFTVGDAGRWRRSVVAAIAVSGTARARARSWRGASRSELRMLATSEPVRVVFDMLRDRPGIELEDRK